jgi:hypothetical protein
LCVAKSRTHCRCFGGFREGQGNEHGAMATAVPVKVLLLRQVIEARSSCCSRCSGGVVLGSIKWRWLCQGAATVAAVVVWSM